MPQIKPFGSTIRISYDRRAQSKCADGDGKIRDTMAPTKSTKSSY